MQTITNNSKTTSLATENLNQVGMLSSYDKIMELHSYNLKKSDCLLVKPVLDTQSIIDWWKNYQDLKSKLLQQSDYQTIKDKTYIKKSWFRKLATAFGISIEITKEERKDLKDHNNNSYFIYEITAKAIAPNGRFSTACASCSSNERSFNHPEHDVRATAQTRATNRAISDLIWTWEVSAEEMGHDMSQVKTNDISTCSVSKLNYNTTDSKFNTKTHLPWILENKISKDSQRNIKPLKNETKSDFDISLKISNSDNIKNDSITVSQRLLLVRLIEKKYKTENQRSSMLNNIWWLNKKEASRLIQEMLN